MMPRNVRFCVTSNLLMIMLISLTGVALAKDAGLKAEDITEFYILPGQEAILRFSLAGTNQILAYQVEDYQRKKISEGKMTLDMHGKGSVKVKLKRGYYEIAFPARAERFGIVCLKPTGQKDSFFCIDSALSWLELRPAIREALIRIMDRSGIAMSRERLSVEGVNPELGKTNWEGGDRKYEPLRKAYRDAELPILDIFNGSSKQFINDGHYYPQQLVRYADSAALIGEHLQYVWGGAEIWNEPDLGLDSGEQYAAMLKAASYGFASKKLAFPVIGCVAATLPPSGWFDTLAANGLVHDMDVFSFHSYDPPVGAESFVQHYRDWLRAAGRPKMPLWHTECGWSWRTGPMRPTYEEDTKGAVMLSGNAVEDFACGVSRFFAFVLVPYGEGQKQFGLLGYEFSPTRQFAAYLATANTLAGKSYLGDLIGLDKSVKLARVFGDKNTDDVFVSLYTGHPKEITTIVFPAALTGVVGIDGREIPFEGKSVAIMDGMVFIRTTKGALGSLLKTDTSTAKLFAVGQSFVPVKRLASPVVTQFLSRSTPARGSVIRYVVSQQTARNLPITARFNNLSDSPIQVKPKLEAPSVEPMPQPGFTIPAHSYRDTTWHFDATRSLDLQSTRFVTVTAETDTSNQPSPLAIPLIMEGTLQEHLEQFQSSRAVTLTNLIAWQENSDGPNRTKFSAGDGIFRMSVTKPGWSYPKLAMNISPQMPQDKGFLVRARIQSRARNVALMVNNGRPDGFWDRDIFKADGGWHVIYIPFDEMHPGPGGNNQNARRDPSAWNVISIGAYFETESNLLEVSNVYIVGGDLHE